LLLPALQLGGAERVAANAVQAVARRHGPEQTLILATDHGVRSAAGWFESNGQVLVLPEMFDQPLEQEEMALLVAQLINWWQPKALLNVNSWAGWRALERFGKVLTRQTAWSAGLFCRDRRDNGLPAGHVDRFLRDALPFLERVIGDHQAFFDQLIDDYALGPNQARKFQALYQPVHVAPSTPRLGERVLWAGRVCAQKRPELLAAVARLLPHHQFDLYGPPVDPESWQRWGLDQPNIGYCGSYSEFSELSLERYGAFLFTSAFEGLPNVLLEASSAGLPLVASAVGGVGELVTPSTGWPVSPGAHEPERLASALVEALTNRKLVESRSHALAQLLQVRHCPEAYWQAAGSSSSFFL
jgi:hypothetical protein